MVRTTRKQPAPTDFGSLSEQRKRAWAQMPRSGPAAPGTKGVVTLKPHIKPFWDVQNRLNKLVVSGGSGQATITIQPKWKNAGGPLRVALDAKGMKAIAKDLSRQGTDPAYVRCTDAPKSRRGYVSSGDAEKVACYVNIVDKTGGKKAERHLRVALGPVQQARLLDALIAYGG